MSNTRSQLENKILSIPEIQSKIVSRLGINNMRNLSLSSSNVNKLMKSNLNNIQYTIKNENMVSSGPLLTLYDQIDSDDNYLIRMILPTLDNDMRNCSMLYPDTTPTDFSDCLIYYNGHIIKIGDKYYSYGPFEFFFIRMTDNYYGKLQGIYSWGNTIVPRINDLKFLEFGFLNNIPVIKRDVNIFKDFIDNQTDNNLSKKLNIATFMEHRLQKSDSLREKTYYYSENTIPMIEVNISYEDKSLWIRYRTKDNYISFYLSDNFSLQSDIFDNFTYDSCLRQYVSEEQKKGSLPDIKKIIVTQLNNDNSYLIRSAGHEPSIYLKYRDRIKLFYKMLSDNLAITIDKHTYYKFSTDYKLIGSEIIIDDMVLEGIFYLETIHATSYKMIFSIKDGIYYRSSMTGFDFFDEEHPVDHIYTYGISWNIFQKDIPRF